MKGPNQKTITEHDHDVICSCVMPYATVLASDWNKVKIFLGDECEARNLYFSDRALNNFRKEWLRRRKVMR